MDTAWQARVLLHLPVLHCCPGTANSNSLSGKDCFETPMKTSQLLLIALQELEIKCNQDWNCQCETDPLLSKPTWKVPQTPGTTKGSREKGRFYFSLMPNSGQGNGKGTPVLRRFSNCSRDKGTRNIHVLMHTGMSGI